MIGNKIEPFKFWCQKVLPTVYEDSLSYYEYLGKLNQFLNEVIEQMNTLTDNMEDYELELTAVWNQTKDWIDHYFDNLNVQSEINNKLDDMATSGTLSVLIEPFVTQQIGGVVAFQIGDVVASQIDDVVASQIDDAVASQISESVAEATADWLDENVDPVGSAVTVDKSLLIDGSAADAKTVGDIVNQIVIRPSFSNTGYAFTTSTGNANVSAFKSTNANYSFTNAIAIKKGDKVIFKVKTDNKYVCPIIKDNGDNTYLTLIAGENGTDPREVTYTATEDMNVILCGRTDGTPYAIIRGTIITEGALAPIEDDVDSVKEFTDGIEDCFGNTNLLEDAVIMQGKMLNTSTGEVQNATSDYYLHIVPVEGGKTYYWTQLCISIYQAAVYDSNGTLINFLYELGWRSWNSYFTLPSNAVTCKMVVNTQYLATKYFGTMYEQWSNNIYKYATDKLYIPSTDMVTIGAGGDYPTIKSGFAAAIAQDKGAYILPGTYNLVSEGVSGMGVVCPKRVVGYGAKITLILDNENWDLSAINIPTNMPECIIEGIEVEVTNGRYCIHDEMYNYGGAYHHVIKNCRLVHNSAISATLLAPRAIGGGIGNKGVVEIYNCYAESKVYYGDIAYHSNGTGNQTGNVYIHVHDNDIAHAVQFNSIGSSESFKNIAYISNNRFGQYVPVNEETYNMKQICWNNVHA